MATMNRYNIDAPITRWNLGYCYAPDESTARRMIAASWREDMKGRPQARHGYKVGKGETTEDREKAAVIWY